MKNGIASTNDVRQTAVKTASQPKSVAVAGDDTVFVIEQNSIEAFRSNQKVYEEKTSYTPTAVSVSGNLVAVGDVSTVASSQINLAKL